MSRLLDSEHPAPEPSSTHVSASESPEPHPELIPLPSSPPSSSPQSPDISPPEVSITSTEERIERERMDGKQTITDTTKDTAVEDKIHIQSEDQDDASTFANEATTQPVQTISAAVEQSTETDPVVQEPNVPVQRTFTSPDGNPVTVIEQIEEPPRESTNPAGPDPGQERIKIVEQPVETIKETVITENPPSGGELVHIIDEPPQVVKDATLIKTQPLESEATPVIESPTEAVDEMKASVEQSVPREDPVETTAETNVIETPGADPVIAIDESAAGPAIAIDEPAILHSVDTEEPSTEPVEAANELVTESVADINPPGPESSVASEELVTDLISNAEESTPEPIIIASEPVVESATLIEQPAEITEEVNLGEEVKNGVEPSENDNFLDRGQSNNIVSVSPVEETREEQTAALPSDPDLPTLQPKAASICAMPTEQVPTAVPKRWSSYYDIKSPVATLRPISPPAATFPPYIAQTETRLLLHRHLLPTADGETHRITDELAQPVFHVVTAPSPQSRDQASKTLISSQTQTPILLVRPRKSPFASLIGAQWHVEALAGFPQSPPRAILKRRTRYWPFCGHRPALTGSFVRHDSGLMQEIHSREDLSNVGGGVLRLGAVEDGPVAAVVQTVINEGSLPATVALRGRTYGIRVGKGFDQALACAVLVALDERRWWWGNQKRKVKFQEQLEVLTAR